MYCAHNLRRSEILGFERKLEEQWWPFKSSLTGFERDTVYRKADLVVAAFIPLIIRTCSYIFSGTIPNMPPRTKASVYSIDVPGVAESLQERAETQRAYHSVMSSLRSLPRNAIPDSSAHSPRLNRDSIRHTPNGLKIAAEENGPLS